MPWNHKATERFWRFYHALPLEVRDVADKNYKLLSANPFHPSLHFKNVKEDLWSARVGMNHRALAIAQGEQFNWVWIGTHAAYDKLIK